MIASLTDLLSRKGKVVLAIWLVLFLIMVPPALKSFELMDMSFNGETDHDPVIDKYFDIPYYDTETMPLLVIDYNNPDGYRQLQGNADIGLPKYSDYIINRFAEDEKWEDKLDDTKGRAILVAENMNETNGALIIGINYLKTSEIKYDTKELRLSIKEYTDDYMYELYEKNACFNTHLSGNEALSYDFEYNILLFAVMAIVIFIVVALILIGLYFGSVMSAIIPATCMVLSVTMTNTIIFGLCGLFKMWILPEIIMLIITLALSFAFSILIVSNYRKELFNGNDHAIIDAVMKSKKPIIASTLFIFISGLFLLFIPNFHTIFTIGLCLISSAVSLFIITFTVPASLITLTKNELFWIRSSNKEFKTEKIAKVYEKFKGIIDRFSSFTDKLCTQHAMKTMIVVLIVIVASSTCIFVAVNDKSTMKDISSTIYTGESLEGLEVLDDYGYGGINSPFNVIMNFNQPVASIEKEIDVLGHSALAIYWNDNVVEDIWKFQDKISVCDENISEVSSIFRWDLLVNEAKEAGIEDYKEIIQYIIDNTRWDVSAIISQEMKLLIAVLPEIIVEEMGKFIDYDVNQKLGCIGYEMLSDNQIVVKHINVSVFTEKCASTSVTIDTTNNLKNAASSAISQLSYVDSGSINGIAVSYAESLERMAEWTLPIVIGVLVIFIILMFLVWTDLNSSLVMLISAAASLLFTVSAAYLLLQTFFPGDLSHYVMLLIPLVSEIVAIWFGFVMTSIVKDNKNTFDAKKQFIPLSVIISVTIICTAIPFFFSYAVILHQLSLIFISMIALDIIVVRVFLMPSLFTVLHFKKHNTE